jgi:hypothetical protein
MKHFTLIVLLSLFSWQANAQITSFPYTEDFESGAGGWTTAGSLWQLGTPSNVVINSAASGVNSWCTNLTGLYPPNANDFVQSPVFDFTSAANPAIQMSIWWESEFSWDGAVLQSSVDGGTTWQNIGALNDPNNWFNDNSINGNPGGQQIGWTGRDGTGSNGWVTASNDLTGLGGLNNVLLRVAFGSDGSVQDDGFAFDDITVVNVACAQPSALTPVTITPFDATFGWTDNAGATEWELEWGAPGFTPGTGTGLGNLVTTNNPELITGLTPATDYDVYVRAVCAINDSSLWTGASSITTLVSCPQPTAFQINFMDTTEAILNWTAGGVETEWLIEWGAVGFTPGTGNSFTTLENPDTLTGLPQDSLFDVYVTAICAVADSSLATGPATTNTYGNGAYFVNDNQCGPGYNDISATGVATNMTDDGNAGVTLPFTFFYQNQLITDVTLSDNGAVLLGTQFGTLGFGNVGLGAQQQGIYAFWDDIEPNTGDIIYQTIGTPGNQQFIAQWHNYTPWNAGPTESANWQIVFDEATSEIFVIYDDVEFNGGFQDFGGSATVGADGPQTIQLSLNNQQYLTDNSCIRYFYTNCPLPVNYSTTYTTTDEAAITWSPGLSNEADWTVIYGPQGFDPQLGGTSVQTSTNALIINPLQDGTIYDVYIYADCNPTLQSDPLVGSFETLPNCADPTGLAGATAVDSIFTAWNWTGNTGFPIAEYAMEYGPTGYMNGMGTQVYGLDTINTTDTLFDATLMSGGLYDVYIQAVCFPDDTSNWVGPITVTMPLTNDSTCLAQAIPVDGVDYSFNGTGATSAAGELAIAPPAGPCNGNVTWCNSSVTASTWYTFVAPASGNVRIDGEFQAFDGQVAVYETSDCNDFNQYNLLGANDDFNLTGDNWSYLNLCGLTPGNTYYMMHDPNGAAGIYSLRLRDVVVEAGSDNGLLDVCLGDTVDLNTQITGADAGGTWTEGIPTAGFSDPIWASAGLASQVYTFQYMVVDGCAVDSIGTSIEVYGPSFAGNDGTINACMNEPVDLLQGLVGSNAVDVTGTWYDPQSNTLATSEIITESIPGQYNYLYIAGNGICPNDTATVTVIVDPSCDYLNLQDLTFNGMDIYPNPTTHVFYIANEGSTEVYNYELTDLNGKVITAREAAITGVETTEVNVEKLETGVYLIRIFNENAEKTFRVVKQ